jgi:uncharacterized protein (TIGR00251 family)
VTSPARSTPRGVVLDIEVKVRASRTRVLGIKAGRLSVALSAPPVDGAANEALRRILAEHFSVARTHVQIILGDKSRRKVVELEGSSLEDVLARLPSSEE